MAKLPPFPKLPEAIAPEDKPQSSPEMDARVAYYVEHGYVPEAKEDYESFLAMGYGHDMAKLLAMRETLLRNGFEVNDDFYQ